MELKKLLQVARLAAATAARAAGGWCEGHDGGWWAEAGGGAGRVPPLGRSPSLLSAVLPSQWCLECLQASC